MGKLNLFIHLNAYRDSNPTNNPSLNNFRWERAVQGVSTEKAQSQEISLAPAESRVLFDGSRGLLHDNTTQYSLLLKPGTSNTYILENVAGTATRFRTVRITGADATTGISVTKSGAVLTFTSVAGTSLALIAGGVLVGDEVRIGDAFAAANRGKFKVLARTATSLSLENADGVAEGPIVLGLTFAEQIRAYSAAGVQIGDKIRISGGFSPFTQDTYEITDVRDDLVEFYSTRSLPQESNVTTQAFVIYFAAKKMIYIEVDKKTSVIVNGVSEADIQPYVEQDGIRPGMYLKAALVWSLSVTNSGQDMSNVFMAVAE